MQSAPLPDSADLIAQATVAAERVLARSFSVRGMTASSQGYPEVWARDTVITFLGAGLSRDPQRLQGLRLSLETLARHQDPHGQIPIHVRVADGHAEYMNSTDSAPWWVIGCCWYATLSGDRAWLAGQAEAIARSLAWCDMRDGHRVGLMIAGECEDWADLLSNRGYVLFPNVLWHAALGLAAKALPTHPAAAGWAAQAVQVRAAIQSWLWVRPEHRADDTSHYLGRAKAAITLRARPYFLPWMNLFEFGHRCDTAGNLLAILCGVADDDQADQILDFIRNVGLDRPFPVKALYPPILPGEPDWRSYHGIWSHNQPHHYHNGGIWPWIGGAYVAALVRRGRRDQARTELERLAASLRQGRLEPWECNEFLHGESGGALGAQWQAWSAGMFIYAKHAVDTGEMPGLG